MKWVGDFLAWLFDTAETFFEYVATGIMAVIFVGIISSGIAIVGYGIYKYPKLTAVVFGILCIFALIGWIVEKIENIGAEDES